MKVTTQMLENRQLELAVEIEDEHVQQALRQTARQLAKQVRIPGFRQGKAPHHMIVRRVGEEALYEEMLRSMGPKWLEEALKEADVQLFRPVEMSDVQRDPLSIKFTIPLPPLIDLGDYRSLRVPHQAPLVSEEQVDQALEDIRQRYAVLEPVEGDVAQAGQAASLDVTAVDSQGEEIDLSSFADEDGSISVMLDEKSDALVPGFAAQLIGAKIGEEKTFSLPMADDVEDESLRGEVLTFTARLEDLRARYVPPLDDALAQTVGNYETMDELRQVVRDNLQERMKAQTEAMYVDMCFNRLTESARIEFPPVLVEEELDGYIEELRQRLQRQKMSFEDMLKTRKQSEADYRDEMRPRASQLLKQKLAASAFVDAEGLRSAGGQADEGLGERMIARLTALCKGEIQAGADVEEALEGVVETPQASENE
ncbi:MAG: trigger factor [Thermoflexales bacterium]|nr:trigger factor [Thermoflexales bacterium]